MSRLILPAVLVAVVLTAAFAAQPGDEPVTVTKQMLADILCMLLSDHYVNFVYAPAENTVVAQVQQVQQPPQPPDPTRPKPTADYLAAREESARAFATKKAQERLERLMSVIHKHVDGHMASRVQ